LELSKFGFATRYMHVANSSPVTTVTQLQHRQDLAGRFKFDVAGKISLNFWLNSGRRFTAGWNETAAGPRRGNVNLYLKHLFLSVQPVKGVEVQYGGIPLARGETTELIGYDNDGYLTGARVSVRRPQEMFFDEVAATVAYLGDFAQPGIDKRFHRLAQSNYHQFLLTKKLGERAAITADYTSHNGADTLRQAVKIKTPKARVLDAVRFENYERLGQSSAYGFALTGEKKATKRLSFTGGYLQIDPVVGALNADRLGRGQHLYVVGSYALTPELTVSTFLTHTVGGNPGVSNRTRAEVLVGYDLLKGLKRARVL
jgi:hypothetical protein